MGLRIPPSCNHRRIPISLRHGKARLDAYLTLSNITLVKRYGMGNACRRKVTKKGLEPTWPFLSEATDMV